MVEVFSYSDIVQIDTANLGEEIGMIALANGTYGLHFLTNHSPPKDYHTLTDTLSFLPVETLEGRPGAAWALPVTGGPYGYQYGLNQLSDGRFVQAVHGFDRVAIGAFANLFRQRGEGQPALRLGRE